MTFFTLYNGQKFFIFSILFFLTEQWWKTHFLDNFSIITTKSVALDQQCLKYSCHCMMFVYNDQFWGYVYSLFHSICTVSNRIKNMYLFRMWVMKTLGINIRDKCVFRLCTIFTALVWYHYRYIDFKHCWSSASEQDLPK